MCGCVGVVWAWAYWSGCGKVWMWRGMIQYFSIPKINGVLNQAQLCECVCTRAAWDGQVLNSRSHTLNGMRQMIVHVFAFALLVNMDAVLPVPVDMVALDCRCDKQAMELYPDRYVAEQRDPLSEREREREGERVRVCVYVCLCVSACAPARVFVRHTQSSVPLGPVF